LGTQNEREFHGRRAGTAGFIQNRCSPVLWPFGPVALVYDVLDTEGKPLPQDVASFFGHGSFDEKLIASFVPIVTKKNIEWSWVDAGDKSAGSISVVKRTTSDKEHSQYRMRINRNHLPAVQFATLTHELGHLFLGHLGADKHFEIPNRTQLTQTQRELEAESVAFIVCGHNGVKSKSETYLTNYISQNTVIEDIDIYQVMRAAGKIESLLGLAATTKYQNPKTYAAKRRPQ